MPFFTFVRRFVDYKCPDLIIDILYDPSFKEEIIKANAVIFIGGRKFDKFYDYQRKRVEDLIAQFKEMESRLIFVENHNVFTSWLIQQGTNSGGMLSYEGKEAGPTSTLGIPSNKALPALHLLMGLSRKG